MIELLLIFMSGFASDVFWTLYIHAAANGKRLLAALYSCLIGGASYGFIMSVNMGILFFLVWILGLGCGTYFAKPIETFIFDKWKKKNTEI